MNSTKSQRTKSLRCRTTWVWPAVLTVLAPMTALAGPWTPAPGSYYLQGSVARAESGFREESSASLYTEVGLLDGLALISSAPVKQVDEPLGAATVSEFNLGLRWRLFELPLVTAIEAGVKSPISHSQTDATAQLLVGQGIPAIRGFFQLAGGYRARDGVPTDEWIASADVGVWLTDGLLLIAETAAIWPSARYQGESFGRNEYNAGGQLLWRIGNLDLAADVRHVWHPDDHRGYQALTYVAWHQ